MPGGRIPRTQYGRGDREGGGRYGPGGAGGQPAPAGPALPGTVVAASRGAGPALLAGAVPRVGRLGVPGRGGGRGPRAALPGAGRRVRAALPAGAGGVGRSVGV